LSRYDLNMDENTNTIIKKGPQRQDWYVVAHAMSLTAAEIPAGLLRTAGIPVYLFHEAISSAIPLTFGPLARIDIAVPEQYYREAKALLEDDDSDWVARDELDSGEEPGSQTAEDHAAQDEDA
jgi:hypothetical protein